MVHCEQSLFLSTVDLVRRRDRSQSTNMEVMASQRCYPLKITEWDKPGSGRGMGPRKEILGQKLTIEGSGQVQNTKILSLTWINTAD